MPHALQHCATVLACLATLAAPTPVAARGSRDARPSRAAAVRAARCAVQRTDAETGLDSERSHQGPAPIIRALAVSHADPQVVPESAQPAALPLPQFTGRVEPHPRAAAPPGPSTLRSRLVRTALVPRAPPLPA